jgi:hypothetical protein
MELDSGDDGPLGTSGIPVKRVRNASCDVVFLVMNWAFIWSIRREPASVSVTGKGRSEPPAGCPTSERFDYLRATSGCHALVDRSASAP